MPRIDGRGSNDLRVTTLERGVMRHAEGSCRIEMGDTIVLCSASVQDGLPYWRRESGLGWVTAEYGMLPRATKDRTDRGKVGGRGMEIQRLIGRSLRAVMDLRALGERTITIDCDVLQADGGTRCAAVTGGFVALIEALDYLRRKRNAFARLPVNDLVAAASVGIVQSEDLLDLCYAEDSQAQVDMNVVATGQGLLVEVQGTAEGHPFTRERYDALLDLALTGVAQLAEAQRTVLGELV
jgi:ribonuclease PH